MEAVTWRGTVYALPWFVDAGLLYYRRDLWRRPPAAHWHELVRRAGSAREPRLHGFVWQGKQYEGLVCNALEYLWSNGGAVLEGERAVLASRQNREALAFMADPRAPLRRHARLGHHADRGAEPAVFGQGRAAFLRNWPYAWRLFQRAGSPVHGKVGVAVLPHFPGGRSAATLGGWQLARERRSRATPRPPSAWSTFMTAERRRSAWRSPTASSPRASRSTATRSCSPRSRSSASLERVFAAARPRPVTPHYVLVSQVLQAELSAAVLAGCARADEALARAQRGVERERCMRP